MVVGLIIYLNHRQAKHIANSQELGSVINISGRQRMLSQWLVKEVLKTDQVTDSLLATNELDSVLWLFEDSHDYLREKSKQLDNKDLNQLFEQIQPLMLEIISEVHDFQNGASSYSREALLVAESTFLPLMDRITNVFEEEEAETFENIHSNVSMSNYVLALVIICSGGFVLLFSLNLIKRFSFKLEEVGEQLQATISREKSKVQKLEFLTNTIKVGIWEKDVKESSEKWSSRLYEILGFSKEDYQGTADEFMSLVHPTDLPILLEASKRSIELEEPTTVELRVKNYRGEYIWVEASGNARKNAKGEVELLVGGVLDVTDRKLLEVQLKVFIERAPAAIAMFDTSMRYLAVSNKWKEDYNIQGQEIIGKSHYEVFPEIGDDWKAIHQKCMKGHVNINDEEPFEREDGSMQYLKWEVRPWYRSEDQVGGLLMFTQDVTQSILEKEELRNAKIQAESAAHSKEEFLATMSHEIRTPLNAIIGIAHILQMEDHKPEQAEQIRLLRFSGENLLSLINDILDISKINSGKIELSIGKFDLRYLIENIKNSLAFKARENLVKLSVVYDDNLPDQFVGDVTRLAQIMNNLVSNAIKFTNDGNVIISVELIVTNENQSRIKISVKDDGIGIDPANQDKIFNSFEQAEEGTTKRFGGTGLGLFITKKLIELMGSTIHVESELGGGSNFYFELELPHAEEESLEAKEESVKPNHKLNDLRVLVAEDNTANQMIVMKYLNRVHVAHDIVSDGAKAVELAKSRAYDMIFMDLQMPVMDGYEATRAIRNLKDEYFEKVPIIALTADAFADIKGQTQAMGMSDFMSKPFKPSVFYDVLRRNVGQVVPTRRQLVILDIIGELSGDDTDFRDAFIQQCQQSYLDFYQAVNLLLVQPDVAELKKEIHKIKSLNGQFKLDNLQNALNDLVSQNESYPTHVELTNRVLTLTKEVIDELGRLSAEHFQ